MRRLLLALTTTALAVGSLSIPATAAGRTRMVDDDGRASPGNCAGSGTAFKKVQAAIDASGRNDTVIVCPGSYAEHVTIGGAKDGLTLRGARPFKAKLVHRASDERHDAVIEIAAGATGVTVQHLVVTVRTPREGLQPVGTDCGVVSGISVLGSATINANRVRAYGATLGICGMGRGISVGDTLPAGANAGDTRITNNLVRDFVAIGVDVDGDGPVLVENNSIRYWHLEQDAGIRQFSAERLQRVAERRRTAEPSGFFNFVLSVGVGVFGSPGSQVRLNEISSGPDALPWQVFAAGLEDWTPRLGAGVLVETNDVLVELNTIRRTVLGIELYDADENVVRRNVSEDHVEGILLTDSDDNVIRGNQVSTGLFGLHVNEELLSGIGDGSSTDNRFIANSALFHEGLDCWDESAMIVGVPVENTWVDNVGADAEPSFICEWD
jgi:parallel beta-helix repeat protein